MTDSKSTQKEVVEAQLDAVDLNHLAEGYDNVDIEGERFIIRLSTDEVSLTDRMRAVNDAHRVLYDESRFRLEDE